MIKLPEPAAHLADSLPLFTESQLLQAVRDAQSAPYCRTCEKAWPNLNGCSHNCTNGDQYKAAPAVVLWRTV